MPQPSKGESKDDFVKRCIPVVLKDKTAKSSGQAYAICVSMFEEYHRTHKNTIDFDFKKIDPDSIK